MANSIELLRRYRDSKTLLTKGHVKSSLKEEYQALKDLLGMIIYWVVRGALLAAIISGIIYHTINDVLRWAYLGAIISTCLYFSWPLLSWIISAVHQRQWPSAYFFERFYKVQKIACLLVISDLLVDGVQYYASHHGHWWYWNMQLKPWLLKQCQVYHLISPKWFTLDDYLEGLAWFGTAILLGWMVTKLQHRRRFQVATITPRSVSILTRPTFRLWIGHSTGQLSERYHGASLAAHQKITLTLEDAAQNMVILGGIGSGKTTCAIHPLLIQLLDQSCGGLIFDIKGDFQTTVLHLAQQTRRPVTLIGPGYQSMNLIQGLTPEVASSFLKSVFLLSTHSRGDSFWIDTATELCRNTLGLLSFLPEHYSLCGLYHYLFNSDHREQLDDSIKALLPMLEPTQAKQLTAYSYYHQRIFKVFDDKVKAGVLATIAQVLSPFSHTELIEAFCVNHNNPVSMEAVLEGTIYLVSLPLAIWGLGGKVAYSLIKLRFYNVMQRRVMMSSWNQEHPVFFLCDEFQEIVSASRDGLSDLNFWDKSRSSKTVGIISAQAISSFYAAIGDQHITHALLQNFRQKICFRTEDEATLRYFSYLTDKVEVPRVTQSYTSGKQNGEGFTRHYSQSQTTSTSWVDKPVLSPQLFRTLSPHQAVALLSLRGESRDDILSMMPVYPENP